VTLSGIVNLILQDENWSHIFLVVFELPSGFGDEPLLGAFR